MTEVSGLINLSRAAGSLSADLEAVSLWGDAADAGGVVSALRCASKDRGAHKTHVKSRNPIKIWAWFFIRFFI